MRFMVRIFVGGEGEVVAIPRRLEKLLEGGGEPQSVLVVDVAGIQA